MGDDGGAGRARKLFAFVLGSYGVSNGATILTERPTRPRASHPYKTIGQGNAPAGRIKPLHSAFPELHSLHPEAALLYAHHSKQPVVGRRRTGSVLVGHVTGSQCPKRADCQGTRVMHRRVHIRRPGRPGLYKSQLQMTLHSRKSHPDMWTTSLMTGRRRISGPPGVM